MADGLVGYCDAPTDERLFQKLAFKDDGILTEEELDSLWNRGGNSRIRWEGYLAIAEFFSQPFCRCLGCFRGVSSLLTLLKLERCKNSNTGSEHRKLEAYATADSVKNVGLGYIRRVAEFAVVWL